MSSLFATLLLIVQLVMAPFAQTATAPSMDADCAGMTRDGAPPAASHAAGDCAQMTGDADGPCQPNGHHCRMHAACSCPCAHTPALATTRPLILEPTPPAEAVSTLVSPAFDPPYYRLLRPPK